jgi:SAM-dependent methyltransferase
MIVRVNMSNDYRTLWERHWWWRSREFLLRREIERAARDDRIERILDVGCGDGLFFDFLGRFGSVEGIEADARRVNDPFRREQIRVMEIDRDFRSEIPYDLIVMLDVLEHIQDDIGVLKALRSSLKPGGRYILTVPALPILWSRHDEANGHFRRYTKTTLREALHDAGFQISKIKYFYFWTVAPMLLRRFVSPAGEGEAAIENYAVAVPPAPINKFMEMMSNCEHVLGRIAPPPIGGSILAIAVNP